MWWRDCARKHLPSVIDPLDRDYRGRELHPGAAAEIVEGDKAAIDACSAVLVYFEGPSVGTAMEILYAWQLKIPVIVVNAAGRPSPWLVYHATQIVICLGDAFRALERI